MDKTRIDWDVDYFSRFDFHNPSTDPGMGVFQNTDGTFDLPVIGSNIVCIEKKTFTHYKNVITWKVDTTRIMLYVPQHNRL